MKPGEKGYITVAYNPDNRPGNFNKKVNVHTNIRKNPYILNIKGKVIPTPNKLRSKIGPLRMDKKYVNFNNLLDTEVQTDSLIVENTTKESVQIELSSPKPYFQTEIKPEILAPGERGMIYITYFGTKREEYGKLVDRLDIKYTLNNKEMKGSFNIAANLKEDFEKLGDDFVENPPVISFDKTIIEFGELMIGETREVSFEFKNHGKYDLFIRSVKATYGATILSYSDKVIHGDTGTIVVSAEGTIPTNNFQKNITVICNDPNNSIIQLRIRGKVVKQ